ncbi:MAG TPA: methyltransferase domain-containing protein [Candidatus Polarisedimenticolia bacterium]|nr:methyltransferase domain-containing protein [Candidatus Polarisedimenticolia bacterium]
MHVFSMAPLGKDLHYFTQRRITRSLPSSDEKFVEILNQARKHLEALHRHGTTNLEEAHFYEFGAGFELGIPLSFYTLGVTSQVIVDIRRLLRIELVNEILRKLRRMTSGIAVRRSPERFFETEHGDRWIDLLQEWYGIRYLAPCDARNTGLEPASIDFVTSTNTLEHIPAEDIRLILKECRRLFKKGGLMSFIIDYQDHYSYADRRITAYNFLKYSDSLWKWYNPSIYYQNRLRHKDYISLFQEAGFEVIEENLARPSEVDLVHLERARLWPRFQENYTISELAVRGAHVVVRAAA